MNMPNVPRDPEDPREKLKKYLEQKMAGDQLMADQDYRRMSQAPQATLMESNRDLGLAEALNRSAAQIGTIGGRAADTKPASDFGDRLRGLNSDAMKGIQGARSEFQDADDRQLRMKQYLADKMQMADDKQLDRDMLKRKLDAQASEAAEHNRLTREKLDLLRKQTEMKGNKPGAGLTPGQESVDRDYGKKYTEWVTTGRSDFQKNSQILNNALGDVEKLKNNLLSPRIEGNLPDAMRPEANKEVQQNVSLAAIGAARAALGSQFTERESFWVQKLSYDPTMSPEANIKKIKRNLKYIQDVAKHNEVLASHFEKNGTLSGLQTTPVGAPPEDDDDNSPPPSDGYDDMSEQELDRLLKEGA